MNVNLIIKNILVIIIQPMTQNQQSLIFYNLTLMKNRKTKIIDKKYLYKILFFNIKKQK